MVAGNSAEPAAAQVVGGAPRKAPPSMSLSFKLQRNAWEFEREPVARFNREPIDSFKNLLLTKLWAVVQ